MHHLDHNNLYDDWLKRLADVDPPPGFADLVMNQITQSNPVQPSPIRFANSGWMKAALLAAALLIGPLPFWFVAYLAHLF